jgi:hypothetical protein
MQMRRNFLSTKNDASGKNLEKSNHIPGIYNYCDRWCERCPFTSRCLNFEMSEEKFGDLENVDITNEVFWQKLSETFADTLSMLKEMAAEKGIDLDSIELDEEEDYKRRFEDPSVVHIISHMAKSYITMVDEWFDSNVYSFEDDHPELKAVAAGESSQSPADEDTITLTDSVEVIRWYQHQMYVKLSRALHSAHDEATDDDLDGYPKDSAGSAKVSLIGMDRSISAWGKIIKFFPDKEDSILGIIAHLERLRRRTETEFPDARAFVRPGFDEINPGS